MTAPPSVYFDNAATSWPKPVAVTAAMDRYMVQCGVGYGRSTGRLADEVRRSIDQLRADLARLIGAESDEVVFTFNATDGLNLAIQGLLLQRFALSAAGSSSAAPGSTDGSDPASTSVPALVVATEIEHNSVLRPLQAWAARGWIRLEIVPCDRSGQIDWGRWEALLRQRPWLVCANHASNVTGIIQPVAQMGEGCRQAGAWFLVDAAQTLGWIPLDVEQLSCDILVAAGHKALHGPLGTGLAYFRRAIQPAIASLRMGGTGSWGPAMDSQIAGPPKWEAGNLNVPGLLGWAAALSQGNDPPRQAWDVESSARAVATRLEHARRLCSRLWTGLERIPGVRLVAHPGGDPFGGQSPRLPIISLTVEGWDPSELAVAMESAGGFVTRAGYHCAPLIHASLGTTVGGTWRLSLGPDNTVDQVERFLQTLKAVCA